MQAKIILLFIYIILISCNNLPESKGDYNELSIVSSKEDREYVDLFISNVFNDSIYTPILKSSYKINHIDPDNFIQNKLNKNIIIISLTHPPDSTIDILSNKFMQKYNKSLFSAYNMYSKNQLLLHIQSHDYDNLVRTTFEHITWIKNEINENISKNIIIDYNKEKKSKEINNLINKKFDINLNIDYNYKILNEGDSFIWIGRGYPYRWIVVNKVKSNNISNFENIKFLHEKYLIDVFIPNRYNSEISYDSYNIVRGLYEHSGSDTGGPFVTYVYEDIYKDYKLYLSGFVNNPGKDKIILLKQLESIFQKIKE